MSQSDLAQETAAQQLVGIREIPVGCQKFDWVQTAFFGGPLGWVLQQGDGQQRRIQQLLRELGELLAEMLLPVLDLRSAGET